MDGEPLHSLDPDVAGPLLRDLHAAMAEFHGQSGLDLWTRALDAAGDMLVQPGALGPLDSSSRALLHRLYVELRAEIERATVRLRPIHGDARAGNLLQSPAGPLWMDFEAVCLGPAEWDLATMPEGTEAWFADVNAALLSSLRRLRQVCLVISCWNQYERTREIARAAELHLGLLRESIRG
jgi:thiamine kinase-like enzyme